jgi:aquaporin Z
MKKLTIEFIGTFFLVLTALITGNPLAIAGVLMVMIYAGGHISGAHYNPAVSLGVMIRGNINVGEMLQYWAAQIIGGILAAIVAGYLTGTQGAGNEGIDMSKSLISELLFTFALVFVVLNVATATRTSGNQYFGLAIAFTVLAGAFTVGSISGGAFNPAVAIGASVFGAFSWSNIWIYLVGNFGGAIIAAYTFKATAE